MGRRLALLIATYRYADAGLRQLTAPAHDAEALAGVLRDPDIAGFEVTMLVNEPHHVVGEAIGDFYRDRRRDDLTLLYFTGHGLKDDDGRLYLAMANTRRDSLLFTSLSADQIDHAMSGCASQRKVLVLDCCYSGAFPAGQLAKADTEVHALERFQGRGRTVLTASDATQYSFEGNRVHGEAVQSVFTRHLVAGLRDGSADLDGDGDITIDELYSYVHDRVVEEMPQQRPKKQDNVQGSTVIARNVNWSLPVYLRHAVDSPLAVDRRNALDGLAHLHRTGNEYVRTVVLTEIRRLVDDDSRTVSAAATLRLTELTAPPPVPPSTPPREPARPAAPAAPEPPLAAPEPELAAEPALEVPSAEPELAPKAFVAPAAPPAEPPAETAPSAAREPAPPASPGPEVVEAEPPRRVSALVAWAWRHVRALYVAAAVLVLAVVVTVIALTQGGTDEVGSDAPAAAGPPVIAVGVDDDVLFAAQGNRLTAYDQSDGSTRTSFLLPDVARAIAVTPDGNRVFVVVASSGPGRVFGYDLGANQAIGEDPVGADPGGAVVGYRPSAAALNLDLSRLYVANSGSGTVSVVATDTMTVIGTIQVEGEPLGVTVSSAGKLYVALGSTNDKVAVYDLATETLRSPITVGSGPYGVAASPDGSRVYVTNFYDDTVSVIDTATDTVAEIADNVGRDPYGVVVAPDNSRAYVANVDSGTVSIVGADISRSVGDWLGVVGDDPVGLAISGDGTRLYVAHAGGVSTIDITTGAVVGQPIMPSR